MHNLPLRPTLLVADSGIGGLSVAAAIRSVLPCARLTYLADHGGFPYGALSESALLARLIPLLCNAVQRIKAQVLVLACNTASTLALPALRQRLDIPVIGCVPPIKPAAACSQSRAIGLLATEATARRPYIQDLITRFASDCRVFTYGSPVLATLAEAVFRGDPVDDAAILEDLAHLFTQPGAEAIDTVALGSTHYAFLRPILQRLVPSVRHWLDPAEPVARHVCTVAAALPEDDQPDEDQGVAFTTAPLSSATAAGMAHYGFHRIVLLETPVCEAAA